MLLVVLVKDTSTLNDSKSASVVKNGEVETGQSNSAQLDIGLNPQQQQVIMYLQSLFPLVSMKLQQ